MKARLKLAKLLHHKGFHITFVSTEYKHLLTVRGPHSLDGLPDFRFTLPPPDSNATQSIRKNALEPFLSLVFKLNDNSASGSDVSPVTCIVSYGFMIFTVIAS